MISCEHGGRRIPAGYRQPFAGFDALLQSPRGFDTEALTLAREMAAARFVSTVNRSIGHQGCTPRLYGVRRFRIGARCSKAITVLPQQGDFVQDALGRAIT